MKKAILILSVLALAACQERTYVRFTSSDADGNDYNYGVNAIDFVFNLSERRYTMSTLRDIPEVFRRSDRYCYSDHEDMDGAFHPQQTRLEAVCFIRRDSGGDLFAGTLHSVPK